MRLGHFFEFLGDREVRLIGVEAGGRGRASWAIMRRSFRGGEPGVLQGTCFYVAFGEQHGAAGDQLLDRIAKRRALGGQYRQVLFNFPVGRLSLLGSCGLDQVGGQGSGIGQALLGFRERSLVMVEGVTQNGAAIGMQLDRDLGGMEVIPRLDFHHGDLVADGVELRDAEGGKARAKRQQDREAAIEPAANRNRGEAGSRSRAASAEIDAVVGDIAASSREQSTALQEVNIAVNEMDQVTQQNAAMAEQATAASTSLSRETVSLSALIDQFEIARHGEVAALRKLAGKAQASTNAKASPRAAPRKVANGGRGGDSWSEF